MQNFLTGDARRAQRLLRNSALSSVVVPSWGAQKMSEQAPEPLVKVSFELHTLHGTSLWRPSTFVALRRNDKRILIETVQAR